LQPSGRSTSGRPVSRRLTLLMPVLPTVGMPRDSAELHHLVKGVENR
jgi:hypothetical protein